MSEQTRLVDLNFNYKRYRYYSVRPVLEKQRQVGLEAFGFILKNEQITDRPKTTSKTSATKGIITKDHDPPKEAEGKKGDKKQKKRKKKKAVVRSPSLSPSPSLPPSPSLSPSLSLLPTCTSPSPPFIYSAPWSNQEIAETQFAQPDSQNQEECRLAAGVNQAEASATPALSTAPSPIHMRLRSPLMLPYPTTPKRKTVLEIPNSHSPPATPISPYKSPSPLQSPRKSPFLSHRSSHKPPSKLARKWRLSGQVISSQWWDNVSQVDTPVEPCGNGEDDEEEDDSFFNQTFPAGQLFQSNRAHGSLGSFDETQLPRSICSPKGQAEGGLDTALVSLTELWGSDGVSQSNIVVPESPQPMRRRQSSFGDRNGSEYPKHELLEIFPRSTQPQNRQETQFSDNDNDNDLRVPESPLNTPHKRRRVVDHDSNDETGIPSALPGPSKPYLEALQGTQYEDGPNEWRNSLPEWTTLVAGEHLIANNTAVSKRHMDASGSRQEHHGEDKASGSDDLLTVSQLLPQSLMESLPVPPPLTQWTISTLSDVDCDDEL